jgi:hypothetical protein
MKAKINTEMLDRVLASISEDKHELFKSLVEASNEMVNFIEYSGRPQLTKDWYGDYLAIVHNSTDILVYLIAGANKQGIAAVKQILSI